MSNNVCAVIVTYNRLNLLKECIEAIKLQTYPCDILVINNNSTDNTEDYLKENNINHIKTDENIGGAGGFNLGMKASVENDYEYTWVMDDDCIPNNNALEKLMEASKKLNNEYGFLASKVLWTDGSLHNMNKLKATKKTKYDNIHLIKQATFVSLLVKKEIIMKYGLPIKEFFIWGDDIEFTRRITVRNKEKSYFVENSIVVHKTKNNIGSNISIDDVTRLPMYERAYKNEKYLYSLEGYKGRLYFLVKCLFNILKIFIRSNNKIERIEVILNTL